MKEYFIPKQDISIDFYLTTNWKYPYNFIESILKSPIASRWTLAVVSLVGEVLKIIQNNEINCILLQFQCSINSIDCFCSQRSTYLSWHNVVHSELACNP